MSFNSHPGSSDDKPDQSGNASELSEPSLASEAAASEAPTIASTSPTLESGGEFGERYRVSREVGRGGMGRVWLARDEVFGREVALKELLRSKGPASSDRRPSGTGGMQDRFLREAKVTGRLDHPSIVPVYEIGEREDGSVYYSMKFIRGQSLAAALRMIDTDQELNDRDKQRARLKLLDRFIDICEALAYAHSKGVIHRDLKPDNIMLGDFGETLVVDWGLAKVRGESDRTTERVASATAAMAQSDLEAHSDGSAPMQQSNPTLELTESHTQVGTVLGTPAYMPPEQATGEIEQVDELADVYSLGAILYQILSGFPPYTGSSSANILQRVVTQTPTPLAERAPHAPRELISLCQRAMERRRTHRLSSAQELATELTSFREGRTISVHRYGVGERVGRFLRKNRKSVAAVSLSLLIAASVGGYMWWQQEQEIAEKEEQNRRDRLAEEQRRLDEFKDLVAERHDLLDLLQDELALQRPQAALDDARALIDTLNFGNGDQRWQRDAVIQRSTAITPEVEDSVARLLRKLQASAAIQRRWIEQVRTPISGELVDLAPQAEVAQVQAEKDELQRSAFELALISGAYKSADGILARMNLSPSEELTLQTALDLAQESLANAWEEITKAVIADFEAGRGRPGRYEEFTNEHGFPPLDVEESVRKLIPFKHERVATLLVERLQPYIERAEQRRNQANWTSAERDAIILIVTTLGELQYPDIAIPAIGAFFDNAIDRYRTRNVFIAAGKALCATEHPDALEYLMRSYRSRGEEEDWRLLTPHLKRMRGAIAGGELETAEAYYQRSWMHFICSQPQAGYEDVIAARELGYAETLDIDSALARAFHDIGEDEKALQILDRMLADNQSADQRVTIAFLHFYRGDALTALGRFEEAIEAYRTSLEIESIHAMQPLNLGYAYMELGRFEEALEAITQSIKVDPDSSEARIARARVYVNMGIQDFAEEALKDLSTAISDNPESGDAWYYRGQVLLALGRDVEAIEALQRSVEHAPHEYEHHYILARALHRNRQFEEALASYQEAIRMKPEFQAAYEYGSQVALHLNRFEKGAELAQTGVKVDTPTLALRQVEIMCLRKIHRTDEARPVMDQLLAEHPDLWQLKLENMKQLMASGDVQAAIDYGRSTLQGYSQDHPAWKEMGRLVWQYEQGQDLLKRWRSREATTAVEYSEKCTAFAIGGEWNLIWGHDEEGFADIREALRCYQKMSELGADSENMEREDWASPAQLLQNTLFEYRVIDAIYVWTAIPNPVMSGFQATLEMFSARSLCLMVEDLPHQPTMLADIDYKAHGIDMPESDDGKLKLAATHIRQAVALGFSDPNRLRDPAYRVLEQSDHGRALWQEMIETGLIPTGE